GTRPTSQNTRNWNRSRERKTPLIVVSMNRNIAKNSGTRVCSSHEIARASGVSRAFRKTRITESSSAPKKYFTFRVGTQGDFSTAKYVCEPGVVTLDRTIASGQRKRACRSVARAGATGEMARQAQ